MVRHPAIAAEEARSLEENLTNLEDGLAEVGTQIGLDLRLDQNLACSFSFGEGLGVTVEFVADREALLIWSDILSVPADHRARLFERALTANANPLKLGGTSIGYDPGQDCLVLSFITPIDRLGVEDIATTIGTFMLIAADLGQLLHTDDPDKAGSDPFETMPSRPGVIFG